MNEGTGYVHELKVFAVLAVLGTAACFLSVRIPHTDVLVEGRWAFGFMGFVLLRHWWSALFLACLLSIPHNTDIFFWTGFSGNLAYALPCLAVIRFIHARWLSRIKKISSYALAWFLLVLFCYQAFITPVVWAVLAMMNDTPVWTAVAESWKTQPYLVESILVGAVSASVLAVLKSNDKLRENQKQQANTNRMISNILDNNPHGIALIDKSGNWLYVNPTFTEITGYTLEDIPTGKQWFQKAYPDPDYREKVLAAWKEDSLRTGLGEDYEFRVTCKNGDIRHIEFRTTYLEDRSVSVLTDLSHKKLAEKELQDSETRLRESQKTARIGHMEYDVATGDILWADMVYELYERDPASGAPTLEEILAVHHPDDAKNLKRCMENAVEKAEPYHLDLRVFLPGKKKGFYHIIGKPLKDEKGTVVKITGTVQDITERKEVEEALREATLQQLEAIRASNVGLWDWNLNTGNVRYSTEWKKQIGYEEHEIGDGFHEWQNRVHPDDLPATIDFVYNQINKKRPGFHCEFRFRHKNGNYRWIFAQASILNDENAKPVRVLGSHVDITDRKIEELVQAAQLRLIEYAADHSVKSLLHKCLDEAETISESKIGFFHLLSDDQKWIELSMWSENTVNKYCTAKADQDHYPVDKAGVWVDCIYQKKPVIYNDYAGLSHKKGLPGGHPEMTRILVVPVFRGDKIVAIIGVGNKKTDYDTLDVQTVRKLADLAWETVTRKKAEEAYRESEERYSTIFEHMSSGLAVYEAVDGGEDFVFKAFNRAAEENTRISREKVIGKRLMTLFPNMDKSGLLQALQRVWKTGKEEHLAPFYYKDNIREGWRENRIFKLPSNEVVTLFDDVTNRLEAEKKLQESEERFRLTFQTSPDSINLNRLEDGMYIDINEGFTNIMGYSREDVIGRTSLELNIWENPEDRQRVVEGLKNHGYVENLEARFVGKDGKVREGLMSARIIRLNEENVIISITRDITEYKRSEEEKAKLEDQFRQSRKMEAIGTLAGGIAHDFNNILFPILGYSEMLKDELPPESTFHMHVDEIIKASMRARDLVMQILTFSRQDEDELKPMKLQPIIKEALKLLRASIPTTIVIKSNIDSACESVMANPTQVHQVIMNLATNAYHAMEEDGGNLFVNLSQQQIEFDAVLFPELATGNYAVLTVSDTGRGIEKENLDRVFEPYFTTKEKGKGTGLGLSVVQGIVKKSKGAVRIHSQKDKGTEIRVYFPVLEKKEEAEKMDHIPAITGGNEKILLVDDEQSIVNAQRRIIEALGYTVTSTTKSTEAFEIFSANPGDFDLIITDMTMPDMTGITLAEKIKSLQPDIPVIICTGFSSRINEEKIKASDIQGFIQKPVRVRQLADTIRKSLDLSKTN